MVCTWDGFGRLKTITDEPLDESPQAAIIVPSGEIATAEGEIWPMENVLNTVDVPNVPSAEIGTIVSELCPFVDNVG